jgi:hypothetical protein
VKKGNHIRNAAVALSDLNTFAIVVSILEGGHVHSESYKAAARIIKICKGETAKRLLDYDAAVSHSQSDASGGSKHD